MGEPSKEHHDGEENKVIAEPDSKMAWLMVACAFFMNFVGTGTIAILGLYSVHFASNEFKDQPQTTLQLVVGCVGSISALCSLLSGIVIQKVGFRNTVLISGLIYAAGMIVTSFASQIWHLIVGESILVGVASSFAFITTVTLLPQWLNKYRGVALGISAAGSGVGGLVLSPLVQYLIDMVGIQWAIRINGIIVTVILLSCGLIVRPRINMPPRSKLVDFSIIKSKKFLSFYAVGLFTGLGFWSPFYLIGFYCKYHGISATSTSIILGLMNGGSAVGRILIGQVSKYTGSINALIFTQLICSLSFVLIWNFATVTWSLIIFAIVFGMFSGAFYTLSPMISPQLFGVEKLAQVNGLYFTSIAPGSLVGPMISQALITLYTTKAGDLEIINYFPMQIYLFAVYIASVIFVILLRIQLTKELFKKI
ncbi:MFS general substrate transporter [Conidiobolus coronatus NRRL 28638]|uniref:MFS general substrate transporter n=1 Tax=Conidiobolus coronatus (strain ATCC 28846 / CBS 209.66 / NRRL 28638) TaxID=796925 RepID=A0A137P1E3_CONC2|nr:MFS general substrate transporter [Conidiobolus coronatus NRRL 28638]|eukprot:KXN68704.1 MFS general substrate transporter [Conidiobolus coronatus NRRL 28638]